MAGPKEYEDRLEKLAIEVSEAKDSTMPNILTKLNGKNNCQLNIHSFVNNNTKFAHDGLI